MSLPACSLCSLPAALFESLEKYFLSYNIVLSTCFLASPEFSGAMSLIVVQNQFAEARVFEPEMVAVDMDCEVAVPDLDRRFADPIDAAVARHADIDRLAA